MNHPDVDTIQTALVLVTRAPSIHNSQPWRWQVSDRALRLYVRRRCHVGGSDREAANRSAVLQFSAGIVR